MTEIFGVAVVDACSNISRQSKSMRNSIHIHMYIHIYFYICMYICFFFCVGFNEREIIFICYVDDDKAYRARDTNVSERYKCIL